MIEQIIAIAIGVALAPFIFFFVVFVMGIIIYLIEGFAEKVLKRYESSVNKKL